MREGILRYDSDADCFCLVEDGEITGLHSGDMVGFRMGRRLVWGRVEFNSGSWCIAFASAPGKHKTTFTLRRGHI